MIDSDNFGSEQKKSPNSERSGVVAGTTSTNGLNQNGNGHLSRWSLTHSDSDAKLSNNTALAKIKIQNVKNEGIFARINENDDSNSIVRKLSDRFGLMRSKSSQSFYQNYKIDVFEDELLINGNKVKFRLSTHPANGDRFAQDNFFDERISVVVFKDGEHCGTDHEKFTEFVYEPSKMTNIQIADSIIDGFESLLYGKGFYDKLGIVKPKEYSITNGIIQSEPSFKSANVIKQSEKQSKKNQNKI